MAETDAFIDDLKKLTDVLSGVKGQLDGLAKSLNTSDEELAELNAGKTAGEIEEEDALVALITAPLVNTLDSISGILNGAAMKIKEMTPELSDGNE